jgi:uncharacterized protein (TIGR00369 family)
MSETNPTRLDAAAVQAILDRSPFIGFLGLRVISVDHDKTEIVMRMPMRPELERRPGTGQFHGGPIAAFVDIVGDFAIGMLLGGGVPTINLRIDYLRPAIGGAVTGTARVRRQGRTVALVDVDVTDEKGTLVAVGRGSYAPQVG